MRRTATCRDRDAWLGTARRCRRRLVRLDTATAQSITESLAADLHPGYDGGRRKCSRNTVERLIDDARFLACLRQRLALAHQHFNLPQIPTICSGVNVSFGNFGLSCSLLQTLSTGTEIPGQRMGRISLGRERTRAWAETA